MRELRAFLVIVLSIALAACAETTATCTFSREVNDDWSCF